MADDYRPKRLLRFSIGMMLFAVLCVCGYFGGYRAGFDRGRYNRSQMYVVSYPVGDLVLSPVTGMGTIADFDSLSDLIVATVSPQDWMANGFGDGEIQSFLSKLSLIISQTKENHEAIAALLERLRKAQP
jgi:hypothetical protein